MSSTVLYKVPERGGVEEFEEYRNSWGGAMFVWNSLATHFLEPKHRSLFNEEAASRVWNLDGDLRLTDEERITLMTTFDNVMVKRENFVRVAEAFEMFLELHPPGNRVESLSKQAATLRRISDDAEFFAVCWNQTTVNCGIWNSRERRHPADEVQPPAPVMHARRAEARARAARVGGDPDAGLCGECGEQMEKVDETTLGKTVFVRWNCKCGYRHLQRRTTS